jgi:hypothetical protein
MTPETLSRNTLDAASPVLFETPRGRVVHCTCCGRFQIEFDHLLLLLDTPGFWSFRRTIQQGATPREAAPASWTLQAHTDAGEVRVPNMDRAALLALHDLLDGAAALRELQVLIESV